MTPPWSSSDSEQFTRFVRRCLEEPDYAAALGRRAQALRAIATRRNTADAGTVEWVDRTRNPDSVRLKPTLAWGIGPNSPHVVRPIGKICSYRL